MIIRTAVPEDAEALLEIYAPYVRNTAITFEYTVPDTEEFKQRIENTLTKYPYLVAEEKGKILGYAYAGSFHAREAYQHAAEVSVYVKSGSHRKHIGSTLYRELERHLLRQNVFLLYACVTVPEQEDAHISDTSIRFHEKMGYRAVGKHELCGYKFDTWYSVAWLEKLLCSRPEKPEPFVPFSSLS